MKSFLKVQKTQCSSHVLDEAGKENSVCICGWAKCILALSVGKFLEKKIFICKKDSICAMECYAAVK